MVWAFALAAVVQTFAIVGLVGCVILARRGAPTRRAVPALILLLVLSDASILATVLTHGREFNRGAVPERP